MAGENLINQAGPLRIKKGVAPGYVGRATLVVAGSVWTERTGKPGDTTDPTRRSVDVLLYGRLRVVRVGLNFTAPTIHGQSTSPETITRLVLSLCSCPSFTCTN